MRESPDLPLFVQRVGVPGRQLQPRAVLGDVVLRQPVENGRVAIDVGQLRNLQALGFSVSDGLCPHDDGLFSTDGAAQAVTLRDLHVHVGVGVLRGHFRIRRVDAPVLPFHNEEGIRRGPLPGKPYFPAFRTGAGRGPDVPAADPILKEVHHRRLSGSPLAAVHRVGAAAEFSALGFPDPGNQVIGGLLRQQLRKGFPIHHRKSSRSRKSLLGAGCGAASCPLPGRP